MVAKASVQSVDVLYRVEIKGTNRVVYQVQGSQVYNVMMVDGRVSSCTDEQGEQCRGFMHRHTCKHAEAAQRREDDRKQEAQPLETSQKGALNGRNFTVINGIPMR